MDNPTTLLQNPLSFVTAVLMALAPWLYNGAPIPLVGKLLTGSLIVHGALPGRNIPPVYVFGVPGTLMFSGAKHPLRAPYASRTLQVCATPHANPSLDNDDPTQALLLLLVAFFVVGLLFYLNFTKKITAQAEHLFHRTLRTSR
jgi:hypothetical protein